METPGNNETFKAVQSIIQSPNNSQPEVNRPTSADLKTQQPREGDNTQNSQKRPHVSEGEKSPEFKKTRTSIPVRYGPGKPSSSLVQTNPRQGLKTTMVQQKQNQ